jgi:hypothetical protein
VVSNADFFEHANNFDAQAVIRQAQACTPR